MSTTALVTQARSALDALTTVVMDAADYRALSESDLLEITKLWAEHQRLAGAHGALAAGEIAHRSTRELGHSGLAQRTGHRTPEELVRVTTGSTAREASSSVRAGRLAHEAAEAPDPATGEVPVPTQPWLRPVGEALTAGTLSVAAADSIGNGLGRPNADISTAVLMDAAAQLVIEATGSPDHVALDADRLYRRARDLRNEIDLAGIADREETRRQARALRFYQRPDGMSRLTWDLDPESAAIVRDLYDRATSPRQGGPRFVSGEAASTAERILADNRTVEQLASDTFLHLLNAGADADSSELLGSGGAVVTVLVPSDALVTGNGAGHILGQTEPVSIDTVRRLSCGGATLPMLFDGDAQPLDLGREQRLFSRKQRRALAARDGGCVVTGCDRPPSWTEAHHIDHWERDDGETNISLGILLCRHHHLLFHNNGWEVTLENGVYWLHLPKDIDPEQKPIRLESKSAAYRDMLRQSG